MVSSDPIYHNEFPIYLTTAKLKQHLHKEHNDRHLQKSRPSLTKQLNTSQHYNQTLTDSIRYADGIFSPYNVFLQNYKDLYYVTHVKISAIGGQIGYNVAIDINLPFAFITEKQVIGHQIAYVKLIPTPEQIGIIVTYLKPKFPQIVEYTNDIYYVVESTFSINSQLTIQFSFFYLLGEGAAMFQMRNKFDGFLGVGLQRLQEYPELNIIVSLFEDNILQNITYSLYIGNEPGYIDSVLFLGGYQPVFIDDNCNSIKHTLFFFLKKENLTELKIFSNYDHTWCLKINNISIFTQNNIPSFYASNEYKACITSTQPFIKLPTPIMNAIQTQLQQDGSLACVYKDFEFQSQSYQLLECSSKLPVFELLKYPTIEMNVSKHHNQQYSLQLTAEDYIYTCWYDVEHYMKKCLTFLSLDSDVNSSLIELGIPFLRTYYTYFNLNNQSLQVAKAFQYYLMPQYSSFWYYTLLALLFFWSVVMITCGVYYKEQMNQMMVFVNNIIKYMSGDQEARRQLIMGQLMDDN